MLNGRLFPATEASSKKVAKKDAAAATLRLLISEMQGGTGSLDDGNPVSVDQTLDLDTIVRVFFFPVLTYICCCYKCCFVVCMYLYPPGLRWKHGGTFWFQHCGRVSRRTSPASVQVSARREESGLCPDGVQSAQWESHWIYQHWAGRSTTWPEVLVPSSPFKSFRCCFLPLLTSASSAVVCFCLREAAISGKSVLGCSHLTKTQ